MKYMILPAPKSVTEREGCFALSGCAVLVQNGLDPRVIRAAVGLKEKIAQKTGGIHRFAALSGDGKGAVCIKKAADIKTEGYHLEIDADSITVTGGDDAGCFYGIKTLLQILDGADGTVGAMTIDDAPDMAHRGFYHDATRGRVPSVDGIKKLVDLIASYKMNSLELYVEHPFDFVEFKSDIRTEDDYLTAEDILDIDEYCYNNFIDFVPSLSTFGHLYELLTKKEYAHLCELEGYTPSRHFWSERMAHHTIDPSNPESFNVIASLVDQYLPLFRSKYFNICCDETFDLCRGRNKGKNNAELYIEFVSKITAHITAAGKTVMMWGDIALEHPELLPRIPDGTVLLNWQYNANPNLSRIEKVRETGVPQIVCPGNNSWTTLVEFIGVSVPNIQKMVRSGYENGVLGMLNTNWGDFGHPAHPECTYYGTVFGACISWNTETEANDDYNKAVSKMVYGTDKNVAEILLSLESAQHTAGWYQFFEWNESRKAEVFAADTKKISESIAVCDAIYSELKDSTGPLYFLAVTAKGIGLLNTAAFEIKQNGTVSTEWKRRANLWYGDYEKCWLSSAKPSEVYEIKNFLSKI